MNKYYRYGHFKVLKPSMKHSSSVHPRCSSSTRSNDTTTNLAECACVIFSSMHEVVSSARLSVSRQLYLIICPLNSIIYIILGRPTNHYYKLVFLSCIYNYTGLSNL